MTPHVESTTSKLASSYGIASASPTSHSTVDALLGCPLARRVDEDWSEIHPDDVGAALCREDRNRTRTGRGVEDALSGLRIGSLDDELVDVAERVRDALVRPVAPHDALTLPSALRMPLVPPSVDDADHRTTAGASLLP